MLQPAHDHAVGGVLWDLDILPCLQALDVDHCAHKLSVQGALVCEALNVLGCVGIDMLERASELVVEPLNKRDNAAGNLEDLALLDGGCLLVVLPLLSVLDNNNLLAVLERLEQLAELLFSPGSCQQIRPDDVDWLDSQLPLLLVHVAGGAGCQVEAGGDECEKDADPLVVVDSDVEQLLHCADLLKLVCVLASTLLDDGPQLLEDALCGVLDGLAAGANGNEAIIAGVDDGLGAELGELGLVLLLLLLGCLLDDLLLLHELLLVLPVQIDVSLVVAVVLLDLLADGVEPTLVRGGHLLGRDLLLLVGLEDGGLEVGDGLDVHLGDLAIILLDQRRHQAVQLVELCTSAMLAWFVVPRHLCCLDACPRPQLQSCSLRGARTV
jgi:hypothetical protein